ncbi:MAG TPA: efflux RND transporter periplasmic adaptor subunit, partial [Chroococcales cyanobacterium]
TVELTGELQPSDGQTVHLAPRVSGVIKTIGADLGQTVEIGSTLFEIDSMELGEAKSDFLRKKALFELAKKNLKREQSLQAAKIGTGQDLSLVVTQQEEAEIELRASKEKLLRLGLDVSDVQGLKPGSLSGSAGFLKVKSPLRGIVLERHAAAGEIVDPTKEVMRIGDLSSLCVWLDVRASEMAGILQAQRRSPLLVKLSVPAFPEKTFTGKVDFVNGAVDETSRTLKARATIRNIEGLLRPGMFCSVKIEIPQKKRMIAVPEEAVLSDAGKNFLFMHLKENYYISRPVRMGKNFLGFVEVSGEKEKISPAEKIVANGSFLLKSDMLRTKMGAGCAD